MFRILALTCFCGALAAQAQIDSVSVVTSAPRTILKTDVPAAAFGADHLEQKPQFTGGPEAMDAYLNSRLASVARQLGTGDTGGVDVEFVVEPDGMVNEARVLQGGDPAFNHLVLNALMIMPDWRPGTRNGSAVRSLVRLTLPLAPL